MKDLTAILKQFDIIGTVKEVKPLGNGLINDTYKVTTAEADAPDYVLQRINDSIFTDVDLLQRNIEEVTTHIRQQLEAKGADDIDRKVLTFVKATNGKTYVKDADQQYWRVSVFIPRAITQEAVNPESSYYAGKTFGEFEAQLTDITDRLGETIRFPQHGIAPRPAASGYQGRPCRTSRRREGLHRRHREVYGRDVSLPAPLPRRQVAETRLPLRYQGEQHDV